MVKPARNRINFDDDDDHDNGDDDSDDDDEVISISSSSTSSSSSSSSSESGTESEEIDGDEDEDKLLMQPEEEEEEEEAPTVVESPALSSLDEEEPSGHGEAYLLDPLVTQAPSSSLSPEQKSPRREDSLLSPPFKVTRVNRKRRSSVLASPMSHPPPRPQQQQPKAKPAAPANGSKKRPKPQQQPDKPPVAANEKKPRQEGEEIAANQPRAKPNKKMKGDSSSARATAATTTTTKKTAAVATAASTTTTLVTSTTTSVLESRVNLAGAVNVVANKPAADSDGGAKQTQPHLEGGDGPSRPAVAKEEPSGLSSATTSTGAPASASSQATTQSASNVSKPPTGSSNNNNSRKAAAPREGAAAAAPTGTLPAAASGAEGAHPAASSSAGSNAAKTGTDSAANAPKQGQGPPASAGTAAKKLTFQDTVYLHLMKHMKPFLLKDLAKELKGSETALSYVMLSLVDKGLVSTKEFASAKKAKSLYWANHDVKSKDVAAQHSFQATESEMQAARQQLSQLQAQHASVQAELGRVLETPSNDDLSDLLRSQQEKLGQARERLSTVQSRIQQQQQATNAGTKGRGISAAPLLGGGRNSTVAGPHVLKARINRMLAEHKRRKQLCADFVERLADGMEKKPKDVVALLDIETDEAAMKGSGGGAVQLPSPYPL